MAGDYNARAFINGAPDNTPAAVAVAPSAYGARAFREGAPDIAPAAAAVADEPPAYSTGFLRRRRQPIDMTDQGSVWAVSDPLGGINEDGAKALVANAMPGGVPGGSALAMSPAGQDPGSFFAGTNLGLAAPGRA